MPIIWTDDEGRITTISYTPRDRGTTGGYDVKSIRMVSYTLSDYGVPIHTNQHRKETTLCT